MKTRGLVTALTITAFSLLAPTQRPAAQSPQGSTRGQSVTVMPDGRWLLIGGAGAGAGASFFDPNTGATVAVSGHMQTPRVSHSATLLPDGTVLVVGGRNGDALVETPELFEPALGRFTPVPIVGAVVRADHTATLLTDGRIVVAGGTNGTTNALPIEIWDVTTHAASPLAAGVDRMGHLAVLQPDGRVLVSGGRSLTGTVASGALAIDADAGVVQRTGDPANQRVAPTLAASMPANGATNVPVGTRLALRFSTAVAMTTLNANTITLHGPEGQVDARVIGAESGRLAFIWPATPLSDGATYTLAINGAVDAFGNQIAPTSTTFTTQARATNSADQVDPEEWIPNPSSARDGWRTNRPPSPWESLPPLVAPPSVTAISGRVLTLDGRPLPDVTLELEDSSATTRTDRTGRFLLLAPTASTGHTILNIDGATVHRPGTTYGFFEYGMTVTRGETTILPFTIWMPKLDTRHVVTIPSLTTTEVAVTTPWIPGLEVHLPAGTHLIGREGKPVTQLGITPIPVDRPPFPLAANVDVPVYFTVQPGSTYVQTDGPGPKGAWIVYPNYRGGVPRQLYQFFHYDPDENGWAVYGTGAVTANAAQVMPGPKTRVYEFTGAMINGAGSPGLASPKPGEPVADPVDPSTGIFVMRKTDLYLPDVIPLELTRVYQSGDGVARPFGFGMTHPYAMFLWSANQYQEADLILPEGVKIHYVRTSPGNDIVTAVFEHTTTPTKFYKSKITWAANKWYLRLQDGTTFIFPENSPLSTIQDRYGNTVTIEHVNGTIGDVTRVTSPNGRWLEFTYETGSHRVAQVKDNAGRTVSYTYDANGNLATNTDPENNVTTYTYDGSHQMVTITDGRNITYLTNEYTSGRVTKQTLADPLAFYQFAYTADQVGNITRTDVTDPNGHVNRIGFNADHVRTSETQAYGTSIARTITYERQTESNFVTAVIDGRSRRTELTYSPAGRVLTETRLAGTANAVTTTYTYEPLFNQLASVTDPLNHTWTLGYDSSGRLTGITDPLSHQTTIAMNAAGQFTSLTDPLTHQWQFGYSGGDLTSTTDPLNRVTSRFVDATGRVLTTTDPLGRTTRTAIDNLNRPTTTTDPLGGQTSFAYDANSNLTSLTDALTHATTYTYDGFDRVATRTDPLQHAESFAYDFNDNPTQTTDRKSQVTSRDYDALDRLTQVTFDDSSTITYTYDASDRVTEIDDSANGSITRTYDDLDRLTEETTAEGTVNYTYDGDGRRASMTVVGQTAVTYTYDDAHRLTTITQDTATVSFTYDAANRRSTLTYPNGIVATSGYDAANQLTSLTYTLGQTMLGDLTYTYDLAGNRTGVSGAWARTGIPPVLSSATYDDANRIATWAGTTYSYDLNGNLTSDGSTTYSWNARNQLTGLSGSVSASFAYDGLYRRRSKTIRGTTTRFLYDGSNFVQEQTSGGAVSANLLSGFGLDETFTRTDSAGMSALLVDALGSTQEVADASGVPQTHYTYEPFGTVSASGGASTNAALFTGRENDVTGLYYYRARYLSSGLQRFVSEDPAGFRAGDPNLYAYTFDAPTRWRDPSGRFVVPLLLCAAGAAGSALADAMGGRKFNAVNAAAWCAAGFGLGFAGPAIGAAMGYGTGAGYSAGAGLIAALGAGLKAAVTMGGEYGTDGEIQYTLHAVRQMVARGVSPESVSEAIANGVPSAGNVAGRIVSTLPAAASSAGHGVVVVTEGNVVITVINIGSR